MVESNKITITVNAPVPSFMSYPTSAETNISGIYTSIGGFSVSIYGGSSLPEAYIQAQQNRIEANASLAMPPLNNVAFYASMNPDMSGAVVIASASFPGGEFGTLTASAVVPISRFASYLGQPADSDFTCYMVAVNTDPDVRSDVITVNVRDNSYITSG